MAVLYGRIFVAIRRRSKLEIWQNAVVVAGGSSSNHSTENSNAGTPRRLLNSTKGEDGNTESDAEEIGCSSRVRDEGERLHEAPSQQPPTIVIDRVQSLKLPDSHPDEHGARSSRLNTDAIETAPGLDEDIVGSSPIVGHRKCVRFLLVKRRESYSNDDDMEHIEMSSVEPSHCETTGNERADGSALPARLIHHLRQRGPNGRRRRRSSQKQNSLSSDVKAAKQLGVIMGAFCICFLPYFVCFVVVALCPSCVDDRLMTTVTWIGYINSTLNPFLYPLCNRQFRISFRRMFANVWRGTATRGSVASSL